MAHIPQGIVIGDNMSEAERDKQPDRKPYLVRHGLIKFDPDAELDSISRILDTKIVNIDAKIFEGSRADHKWNPNRRKHYRKVENFFASPYVRTRLREAYRNDELKELKERLKESSLRESVDYPDERPGDSSKMFALSDTVLPGVFGHQAKQMTLYDVLDQYRKGREAAYRNPIGKRIVKLIASFVVSRGVKGTHTGPDHMAAWQDFWKRNGMRMRIKDVLRELLIYGDQFLRYYETEAGLIVRQLDPETIWEIVTEPEDIEQVLYYHQQFVTPTQLIVSAPLANRMPASTLVIRQHPAASIDHFKINCSRTEKRGRSELFAILAWLVRFREFANDRVILAKMQSMFALDVAVEGTQADVDAANAQFATPPGSGSVLVHNKKVEIDFKNANKNANESKTDAEMILKIIAVGSGVSEQFLGVSYQTSRAGALVQTEPDVKNFEDYREIIEEVLQKSADRVFDANGLEQDDAMEFTFPGLASEDRSAKVKDLALAESMDYFSKKRAAEMTAREFDVTNYSFDAEQEQIRQERADNPVIAAANQQVQKIAPDPMDLLAAQAAAKGVPGSGGKPGPKAKATGSDKKPVIHAGAQAGFRGDMGGRGLARTTAKLARGKFSRGNERASLKTNRTSQTPRVAETETSLTRPGWTEQARSASIMTRKRRKAERLIALANQTIAEVESPSSDASDT